MEAEMTNYCQILVYKASPEGQDELCALIL